jgi:hypothetical protein
LSKKLYRGVSIDINKVGSKWEAQFCHPNSDKKIILKDIDKYTLLNEVKTSIDCSISISNLGCQRGHSINYTVSPLVENELIVLSIHCKITITEENAEYFADLLDRPSSVIDPTPIKLIRSLVEGNYKQNNSMKVMLLKGAKIIKRVRQSLA